MPKKKMMLEEKLEDAVVKDIPYEVPANWCWIKLGSCVTIKRGASPRPIKSFITENDGVNWIKIGDTDNGKYIASTEQKITNEGAKKSVYLEKDTLVLSNSMSFGRPYILKIPGCIHDGWLSFSDYQKIFTQDFLYYTFLNSDWYFDKVATGSAVRNLNRERVSNLPCAVPPLKEQQRIVDKIESLFEKLDKAKELIQEARDDFEKRKSSILEKAFRGELSQGWREENNINKEWRREKLKDISKITSGGTPSRKHPEYFEGKIPWIKTGEIIWNKIYDSEEHITEEAIANSSAKLIPEGAVLVAMYGQGLTRGRASILEREACTNQAVCALIPSDTILNSYLYYYFMSNYWRFRQVAKGGNQENLSGKVIGDFEIDIPSLEEQNEIVAILDRLLEEESKIEELTTLEEQIELIKKSVLAKAFRGQLGTNCEGDERALELLKKILST